MSLSDANNTLRLIARLLDANTATEPVCPFPPQKPLIPAGDDRAPLPRALPESCGVSSAHIAAFLQALQNTPSLHMHSILILRHGKVLCEAAFGMRDTTTPRHTFSACKSVTALAVGLAMDDGLLSPDDRLTELFPEACGVMGRRIYKDLTLSHLLSMQVSSLFNEAACMARTDWVRGYFTTPGLGEQGKGFHYNSLSTYLLSALITEKTGRSLSAYLQERLFDPLGIHNYFWEKSPEGIEKGGWGLYISPESLGKLGALVLQDGQWEGRQLISQGFLRMATTAHATPPPELGDFDYGWQIWVGRNSDSFLFNGMLGQNVLCFRENGIVLVSHAGNDENYQTSPYFPLAETYFAQSFPDSLPRNRAGQHALDKTLAALAAVPHSHAQGAQAFLGRRLLADDPSAASAGLVPLLVQALANSYSAGLQAITLGGTAQCPEILYEERDQLHHLLVGLSAPLVQQIDHHGNRFTVAVLGRFTHDEEEQPVFRVQLDFLETASTRVLKFFQTRSGIVLRQEERPGCDYVLDLVKLLSSSNTFRAMVLALLGTADPSYLRHRLSSIFTATIPLRDAS